MTFKVEQKRGGHSVFLWKTYLQIRMHEFSQSEFQKTEIAIIEVVSRLIFGVLHLAYASTICDAVLLWRILGSFTLPALVVTWAVLERSVRDMHIRARHDDSEDLLMAFGRPSKGLQKIFKTLFALPLIAWEISLFRQQVNQHIYRACEEYNHREQTSEAI